MPQNNKKNFIACMALLVFFIGFVFAPTSPHADEYPVVLGVTLGGSYRKVLEDYKKSGYFIKEEKDSGRIFKNPDHVPGFISQKPHYDMLKHFKSFDDYSKHPLVSVKDLRSGRSISYSVFDKRVHKIWLSLWTNHFGSKYSELKSRLENKYGKAMEFSNIYDSTTKEKLLSKRNIGWASIYDIWQHGKMEIWLLGTKGSRGNGEFSLHYIYLPLDKEYKSYLKEKEVL